LPTIEAASGRVQDAEVGRRPAYFPSVADQPVEVPVYSRDKLLAGHAFGGPAIVEQYDSTIVIHPEQWVTVDSHGNLRVRRRKEMDS
jgi:N-methylhydantoinase A